MYPNEDFENYQLNQSFISQNSDWTNNLDNQGSGTDNIVDDETVTLTAANGSKVLQVVETAAVTRSVSSRADHFDHPSGMVSAGADVMIPTSDDDAGISFAGSGSKNYLYLQVTTTSFKLVGGDGKVVLDDSSNTVTPATNVWYRIRATMNIDPVAEDDNQSTFDLTVTRLDDGSPIGTLSGDVPGDPTSIQKVHLYSRGAHTVYFDNVFFRPVPEPAGLSLLAMGGLLLLRRRRPIVKTKSCVC